MYSVVSSLMVPAATADVAFVGGSLVPVGGHNLLEPAVLGVPMLSGPHTQNAQDVAELLANCGALRIVRSREELGQRVAEHREGQEVDPVTEEPADRAALRMKALVGHGAERQRHDAGLGHLRWFGDGRHAAAAIFLRAATLCATAASSSA